MQEEPEQKDELLPAEVEDYGGPVKSFLEHLEDLRWMLIRVVVSVLVGMLVCLVAANRIVHILAEPLVKANVLMEEYSEGHLEPGGGLVFVQLGTNVWKYKLSSNEFSLFPHATNNVAYRVFPMPLGTNLTLQLQPIPIPEREQAYNPKGQLVNLGVFEGFKNAIQVALYGGIALASPFIFLFIGQFVIPALKKTEKKWLYQAVTMGAGLFIMGVLFCYFVLLPVVILAAVQFSNWLGFGADQWRAVDYIGTVCQLMLGMGLGFELPIVVLTLVKIGLLDYQTMKKFRPYFVVVNLIISAFVMPPDGLTMFLMAIPVQILFEVSLFIARLWSKREKEAAAE